MAEPYQPNFTDPRVVRRIRRALGWVAACMEPDQTRHWRSTEIDRWCGQGQHDLGSYIRGSLLIPTESPHKNLATGYRLNLSGYHRLARLVGLIQTQAPPQGQAQQEFHKEISETQIQTSMAPADWALREFHNELRTGQFSYQLHSDRHWHPLQNMRRAVKARVFHQSDYRYQYDIQCAAQTLLLQYSQQIPEKLDSDRLVGPRGHRRPLWLQGPMDQWLPNVQAYISDRRRIRQELSERIGISTDLAKQIITALFAGARISVHHRSAISRILDGRVDRIQALRTDPFIAPLKDEIRTIWEYIRPTMSRRTQTDRLGRTRRVPITSRERWRLYFQLERQVLAAISDYLMSTGNQFFTEHDGWVCRHPVNQTDLIEHVRQVTGFQIQLDLCIL